MKRFKFPLRPVAVLRAHRELQARQALAAAAATLQSAEAVAAAARARAARLEGTIAEGRASGFQPALQVAFLQDYRRERLLEADAAKRAESARNEVARCRKAAMEAHRDLKIVSRLEERARAAHRQETLRAEQNEIDERAGYAAAARLTRTS